MNLEYYIQQLLFSFDCVIIPNFGGIVAQPTAAAIHSTQHVFYAPKKQLAFNKNLDKTDGLLVNLVALNKNISYQEATEWVEEQVQLWINELKESKKISVAEVGRFFLDKESKVQFEPASFVNYNVNSFGCFSFYAAPVETQITKAKQKAYPKFVEPTKIKEPRKINFKKFIPYAVALPILAIALYIPTQTNLLKGTHINLSSLNPVANNLEFIAKYSERIPVSLPSLEVPPFADNATNTNPVIENAPIADNTLNSKPATETNSGNKYHLIVGAFATQENANNLVAELNQKGFHAYIQGTNSSGLIRVSCNGFNTKSEANSAKIEAKEKGVDAWLLQ
jgi:hypothetical protein